MSKKHWGHFLPEAGKKALHMANSITNELDVIETLQKQIDKSNAVIRRIDDAMFEEAKQFWTTEEIAEAKRQALQYNARG